MANESVIETIKKLFALSKNNPLKGRGYFGNT